VGGSTVMGVVVVPGSIAGTMAMGVLGSIAGTMEVGVLGSIAGE
jgi:hypothetical protein